MCDSWVIVNIRKATKAKGWRFKNFKIQEKVSPKFYFQKNWRHVVLLFKKMIDVRQCKAVFFVSFWNTDQNFINIALTSSIVERKGFWVCVLHFIWNSVLWRVQLTINCTLLDQSNSRNTVRLTIKVSNIWKSLKK